MPVDRRRADPAYIAAFRELWVRPELSLKDIQAGLAKRGWAREFAALSQMARRLGLAGRRAMKWRHGHG